MAERPVISSRALSNLFQNVQLEDGAQKILQKAGDEFIDQVLSAALEIALSRDGDQIDEEDIKYVLAKCWDIRFLNLSSNDIKPVPKLTSGRARREIPARRVYNTRNAK